MDVCCIDGWLDGQMHHGSGQIDGLFDAFGFIFKNAKKMDRWIDPIFNRFGVVPFVVRQTDRWMDEMEQGKM